VNGREPVLIAAQGTVTVTETVAVGMGGTQETTTVLVAVPLVYPVAVGKAVVGAAVVEGAAVVGAAVVLA
jgi:hypothetical protein